ncbi:MAG: 1-acyl-sn-glycerol-3-phosphate acyltransferase [Bacteroidetes bacterium]|nr:1-acyl-sn-glycerol-3-phosphate acyltransferase [Bacteroidota bacterium]
MKQIKLFFNSLYSLYVIVLFFVFIPLVLVYYILVAGFPRNRRMRLIFKCHKVWLHTWAFLSGIKLNTVGHDKIDPDQTYVFLLNHRNMFDMILAGSCIQHAFQPLVKKELFKIPGLGWLFAMASVPVNRSSPESRKQSFDLMMQRIQEKTSILIFPEGTRNRTPAPLKAFYDGGFRLAIMNEIPVVPVVLIDLAQLQPVDTFRVYPGTVSLHFLDPISTEEMTEEDIEPLKKRVYDIMERFIQENDKFFREEMLTGKE